MSNVFPSGETANPEYFHRLHPINMLLVHISYMNEHKAEAHEMLQTNLNKIAKYSKNHGLKLN